MPGKENKEKLPRPAAELAELADHYDEHDTTAEMADGRWVEPMVTTSLRLPRSLFEQLKENARREGKRHTAYIREVLEHTVSGTPGGADELGEIQHKLDVLLERVKPAPKRVAATAKSRAATRSSTGRAERR